MQVNAQHYFGHLLAPPSKSHGQRLLLLAALSDDPCHIEQLGDDNDTRAMAAAIAGIQNHKKTKRPISISVGESGFALRTLAFVAAAFFDSYELTGKGTLRNRQHFATIHLLEQLGLSVIQKDGVLPITVHGAIHHTEIEVDASEGSQFVSGLFMLAAKHPGNWKIKIKELNSRPYFEMTLAALQQFGFQYAYAQDTYEFNGNQTLSCVRAQVEGDWSSVAAHLVGAAIQGELSISGLNPESLQPDKNLLGAIDQFGAKYEWKEGVLFISESKVKTSFDFDCTQQPDLFPVLVVLACAAIGTSSIHGIHRLQNKESDRLSAMCAALQSWGVAYQIEEQKIDITGKGTIEHTEIETFHDHRIVMAGCVASLLNDKGQELTEVDTVQKSYPDFIKDFKRLTNAQFF
jgi:3-phosphoshikimate 1-carboxyvinyltransferase